MSDKLLSLEGSRPLFKAFRENPTAENAYAILSHGEPYVEGSYKSTQAGLIESLVNGSWQMDPMDAIKGVLMLSLPKEYRDEAWYCQISALDLKYPGWRDVE